MRAYIIRRLILIVPTLFIISLLVFFAIRLIPGDVIDIMIGEMGSVTYESKEATREMLEKRLGLDVPVHIQYGRWIAGIVLRGDLGMSLWKQTPVSKDIAQKMPASIELGIFGLLTALIISFPIGIYSAMRQDTVSDYIGRSFAIACIAIPSFWLGIMVVVFPSVWLGWSPSIEFIHFTEDPLGNIGQFVIPGTILGMSLAGTNMRMIRTMMLEVLREDYIRTAWAKGLNERTVVVRHALKNALIPVITLIGLSLPVLIGGTVIIEQIFTIPGVGRYLVTAALQRDFSVISAVTLIIAVFVLFINLGIDLLYSALDPRIRYN